MDLFSGIGGFSKGLLDAGFTIENHYFSEINKYAIANYKFNFKDSIELGSVSEIKNEKFKNIDIITAGFPCQPFSVAGKRLGFEDTRGTLFFEAARICNDVRPKYVVFENVKGLLNNDNGKTFRTIISVLTEIGYEVEWQLVNSNWFLPQNRERVYIVGHLGKRSYKQVFPIGEDDSISLQETRGQKHGIYSTDCTTITCGYGTRATDTFIRTNEYKTRIERVGEEHSQTLDTACNNSVFKNDSNIRRLTEIECERLQGFPDDWTKYGNFDGVIKEIPKTQRYKLIGNSVTVKVVEEIAKKLKTNNERSPQAWVD